MDRLGSIHTIIVGVFNTHSLIDRSSTQKKKSTKKLWNQRMLQINGLNKHLKKIHPTAPYYTLHSSLQNCLLNTSYFRT
jgi:hypothetical protein